VALNAKRADTLLELGWRTEAWEYAAQLVARERNGPVLQITLPQPESAEVRRWCPPSFKGRHLQRLAQWLVICLVARGFGEGRRAGV